MTPGPMPGAEAEPSRRAPSNLTLRVLTAVVGLPLIVGATFLGGWVFAAVVAAVLFLSAIEFQHGWLTPTLPLSETRQFMSVAGACGAMALFAHEGASAPALGVGLAALLAAAGYSETNRFGPRKPLRVMAWCLVYIGLLGSTLVLTRELAGGRDWVFIGILATFATDTGAYAVGRLIGRHPLAPKISPKKTREGAVGGYIAGVAAVFALNEAFDTSVSAAEVAILAFVLPVSAMVGDLFESWMKRRMGVKDASGLLPGHGGFMDRLDSILFVMPLVYLFLRFVVL